MVVPYISGNTGVCSGTGTHACEESSLSSSIAKCVATLLNRCCQSALLSGTGAFGKNNNAFGSFIGAGAGNQIVGNGNANAIVGGQNNLVSTGGSFHMICNGGSSTTNDGNQITGGNSHFIGCGLSNRITASGTGCAILAGGAATQATNGNTISGTSNRSTIFAGQGNSIASFNDCAVGGAFASVAQISSSNPLLVIGNGSSGSLSNAFVVTADGVTHSSGEVPFTNNASSLGTSALRWSNVYSVGGNFTGDVAVSGTTSATKLSVTDNSSNSVLNADTSALLVSVGSAAAQTLFRVISSTGSTSFEVSPVKPGIFCGHNVEVLGNMFPGANATYDLGRASTLRAWNNIYVYTQNVLSDQRMKKDIVDETRGLDYLLGLRPVQYTMQNSGATQAGLVAQEVAAYQKSIGDKVQLVTGDPEDCLFLNYNGLFPIMVKAFQEMMANNASLQSTLATAFGAINTRLGALESMNTRLSAIEATPTVQVQLKLNRSPGGLKK